LERVFSFSPADPPFLPERIELGETGLFAGRIKDKMEFVGNDMRKEGGK